MNGGHLSGMTTHYHILSRLQYALQISEPQYQFNFYLH